MNYEDIKKLSLEAAADPQPGDAWHEMFSFWMHVIDRQGDVVTLLLLGPSRTIANWDSERQIQTVAEFKKWVSYTSIEGTWCHISQRHGPTVATCWRERYAESVRAKTAEVLRAG